MPAKGWKKSEDQILLDMDRKIQDADEKIKHDILLLSDDVKITNPDFFKGSIPPEQKLFATIAYLITRSSIKAEAISGVRNGTIRQWKKNAPWWGDAVRAFRAAQRDELVAKLSKIAMTGLENAEERLENGDEVVLTKTGKIIRRKVSARDAAWIAAVATDKVELLTGNPTQRVEKVSQEDNLKDLQKQFKAFTKAKTIEGEVLKEEE